MVFRCCALIFFFVPEFLTGAVDAYLLSAAGVDQRDHLVGDPQWRLIMEQSGATVENEIRAHRARQAAEIQAQEEGSTVWNKMMDQLVNQLLDEHETRTSIHLPQKLGKLMSALAKSDTPLPRSEFPTEINIGKWMTATCTGTQRHGHPAGWPKLLGHGAVSFETERMRQGFPNAKAPENILATISDHESAGIDTDDTEAGRYKGGFYPLWWPAPEKEKEFPQSEHVEMADRILAREAASWNDFVTTSPEPIKESLDVITVHIQNLAGEVYTVENVSADITFAALKDQVYNDPGAKQVLGVWDEQTHAYNVEGQGDVYYEWRLRDSPTGLPLSSSRTLRRLGIVDGSIFLLIGKPWKEAYFLPDYPQESLPFHFARHARLALQEKLGPHWTVEISQIRVTRDNFRQYNESSRTANVLQNDIFKYMYYSNHLKLIITPGGRTDDGLTTRADIP